MSDVDIVITWVDDQDPAWLQERSAYMHESGLNEDISAARFRDWGLLPFVFRGIEKFAPWVRKIHFVTWGHIPEWLNLDNSKLNIVKHEEFIPAEFRPTFNSNTIDWNLFRISDMSERFILFNDDMLLLKPTLEEDFFKKGLPCGAPSLEPYGVRKGDFFYTPATNCAVLNDHFNYRDSVKKNLPKWINPRYGFKRNVSTLLMLPYPVCYGFYCWHLPNAFLKSTFKAIWELEPELLTETCAHRFRMKTEPNQWLAEEWQYLKGDFAPRNASFGSVFQLGKSKNEVQNAIDYIVNQKGKCVCVNDAELGNEDIAAIAESIRSAFEKILPDASSFELA